jgi:hypothetical protein
VFCAFCVEQGKIPWRPTAALGEREMYTSVWHFLSECHLLWASLLRSLIAANPFAVEESLRSRCNTGSPHFLSIYCSTTRVRDQRKGADAHCAPEARLELPGIRELQRVLPGKDPAWAVCAPIDPVGKKKVDRWIKEYGCVYTLDFVSP